MPISPDARNDRRREILTILRENVAKIGSQQEIVELLRQRGIEATQSSVSRDLAALHVLRVNGKYEVDTVGGLGNSKLLSAMFQVRHVEPAGPYITVLTTAPASAKAVALGIQSASWPEIKGIIAEDATIFLATAVLSDQKVLLHRISQVLNDVRPSEK
jgi:transcriptional regulator of arginine metabolism